MDDEAVVLDVTGLQRLIDVLLDRGYTVVGPTMCNGTITYASITSMTELPVGVRDEQIAGSYRIETGVDERFFGFASAGHSWKPFLLPSRRPLFRLDPDGTVREEITGSPTYAFLGVRACDLAAIRIHDAVFQQRAVVDEPYADLRRRTFIIAVTCAVPSGTCFCASMGTGPKPSDGYDIALTELLDAAGHRFVVSAGSERGQDVVAQLDVVVASAEDVTAADAVAVHAAAAMGRSLDVTDIRALLYDNVEHPRWADVASRCLSCANCTLVCPTCFCMTVEDETDLGGSTSRSLVWDSCFTADHSVLHGGPVRGSTRARYRQWATHKLASWIDQFGMSGCVGCGRCITWCPVGIDITEEVAAIRSTPLDRWDRQVNDHA